MKKDFHILSLSGGGFRGLYTATILEALENSYKKPLANAFDLICGTSIGGILALGLATEIPASELKQLFVQHGSKIFPKIYFPRFKSIFCSVKYSSEPLKYVLKQYFGEKTIGDLRHRVLIPTVNCDTGLGQFLKTPHHPSFMCDYRWPLVDAALATSAAPTYFPIFSNNKNRYVDGGLVGNSPALFGYHEAKHFLSNDDELNIKVLSIGTAGKNFGLAQIPLNAPAIRWKEQLVDLVYSAQEGSTNYILRHLLGDNFYNIDDKPSVEQCKDIALDKATKKAITVLTAMGTSRAQSEIGKPEIQEFLRYTAPKPKFFYGPNKSI